MRRDDFDVSWTILSEALEFKCAVDEDDNIVVMPEYEGTYTIPSKEEILMKIEEISNKEKIDELSRECSRYIYSKYPQSKQSSDLSDKEYYVTILKANGIVDLEKDIYDRITRVINGEALNDVVDDVVSENQEAYKQLIKTGVRIKWVQDCKKELKDAIAEDRDPVYPDFPIF